MKFKRHRTWREALSYFFWNYVVGGIIVIGGMVLFVYLAGGSLGDDDPAECPQGVTWGC